MVNKYTSIPMYLFLKDFKCVLFYYILLLLYIYYVIVLIYLQRVYFLDIIQNNRTGGTLVFIRNGNKYEVKTKKNVLKKYLWIMAVQINARHSGGSCPF